MKDGLLNFAKSLLSRKFIIWVVATVLAFMKLIDGYVWAGVTAAYFGVNIADWVIISKKNGKETPSGGTF